MKKFVAFVLVVMIVMSIEVSVARDAAGLVEEHWLDEEATFESCFLAWYDYDAEKWITNDAVWNYELNKWVER